MSADPVDKSGWCWPASCPPERMSRSDFEREYLNQPMPTEIRHEMDCRCRKCRMKRQAERVNIRNIQRRERWSWLTQ